MTRAVATETQEEADLFFIAIPKQSYIELMEKARIKQTTVAILLGNALKIALER